MKKKSKIILEVLKDPKATLNIETPHLHDETPDKDITSFEIQSRLRLDKPDSSVVTQRISD